jgi:hypothetical protein
MSIVPVVLVSCVCALSPAAHIVAGPIAATVLRVEFTVIPVSRCRMHMLKRSASRFSALEGTPALESVPSRLVQVCCFGQLAESRPGLANSNRIMKSIHASRRAFNARTTGAASSALTPCDPSPSRSIPPQFRRDLR